MASKTMPPDATLSLTTSCFITALSHLYIPWTFCVTSNGTRCSHLSNALLASRSID